MIAGAPPDPATVERLRAAREAVLARIANACAHAGRSPADVTLVAVSKTVPAEQMRAAVAAGHRLFGENRVQEASAKAPELADLDVRWHLVGPLQANKARRAVELFSMVQSLDSAELALRLDRLVREVRGLPASGPVPPGRRLPVLVQVNVDRDQAKAGLYPEAVDDLLPALADLGALDVAGLMTIGRLVETAEAARPTFRALRVLSESLRLRHAVLGPALSMGMSADYDVAVEEGATIVRVGRALFGERPTE